MERRNRNLVAALAVILVILAVAVLLPRHRVTMSAFPMPTDYSIASNWYDNGLETDPSLADVFYVLPTCVYDTRSEDGTVLSRYADPDDAMQRANMDLSYDLADRIFADSANFFSPYYKHISLDVWIDGQDSVDKYSVFAMDEIRRAFGYYMDNFNEGRPFVLAGFSQGGMAVVELLKGLSPQQKQRLVAAYVCGFKVTEEDMKCGNIIPSQSPDDTGVTIAYNSLASDDAENKVISNGSVFCTNPISWTPGTEPATYGDMTVSVSPSGSYLLVEGVDPAGYYNEKLSALTPYGNLHLGELTLYQNSLRDNVKLRIRSWGR